MFQLFVMKTAVITQLVSVVSACVMRVGRETSVSCSPVTQGVVFMEPATMESALVIRDGMVDTVLWMVVPVPAVDMVSVLRQEIRAER